MRDDVPSLMLPEDVHPLGERLDLSIDPTKERFYGIADLDVHLDRPRAVVWLHGKELHVTRATITPKGAAESVAKWEEKNDAGVVALTPPSPVPAGDAVIHVEYDAPFATTPKGLFRVQRDGDAYAFTQFEAIAARRAFPSFDEPRFKIPYTVTLVVPARDVAIANAPQAREVADTKSTRRVTFAPTAPLPSYLVAFAVGPLDVVPAPDVPPNAVRSRPLPLRAVAAKGRGPELAYAAAHTGEIVSKLEEYIGIAYPYEKLDVLAVPDKEGAMENAGAITFRESYLLFDPKTAPTSQRHGFASVMAHELAHQWVGDLVTMKWWDDTWLNEAFATWLGAKIAHAWDPSLHADLDLVRGAEWAMGLDSLASARQVRQPILSNDDIENAFDGITYEKGGAVLGMFEHWVGEDVFRRGLHDYLEAHRFGNAGADDFLSALSRAAGRDVGTPFHTFLDQPGVPLVTTKLACEGGKARLHLAQSRYLPLGSSGEARGSWQIPVRIALPAGKPKDLLLATPEADVDLDACDWYFPNADAAGYYRVALAPDDVARLRTKALASLPVRERLAFADAINAGFGRGSIGMGDALGALAPLAADDSVDLASAPMAYVEAAREWLWGDPLEKKVEAYARALYAPAYRRLGGFAPPAGDTSGQLRARVVELLAFTARDEAVRAEAKRRGLAFLGFGTDGKIHKDAVDPNLAGHALAVVGEDADAKTWEALLAALDATDDDLTRSRILHALGETKDPVLSARVRELALGPRVRVSETLVPLHAQLAAHETRAATWTWMKDHFDALLAHVSQHHGGVRVLSMPALFCDDDAAADVEAFLKPRAATIEGGPRVLASTLESIRVCAARQKAQVASARAFFGAR